SLISSMPSISGMRRSLSTTSTSGLRCSVSSKSSGSSNVWQYRSACTRILRKMRSALGSSSRISTRGLPAGSAGSRGCGGSISCWLLTTLICSTGFATPCAAACVPAHACFESVPLTPVWEPRRECSHLRPPACRRLLHSETDFLGTPLQPKSALVGDEPGVRCGQSLIERNERPPAARTQVPAAFVACRHGPIAASIELDMPFVLHDLRDLPAEI